MAGALQASGWSVGSPMVSPAAWHRSSVSPRGATVWPFMALTRPVAASWTSMTTSPPRLSMCGFRTHSARIAATAASIALPPSRRTPAPASAER